MAAMRPSERAMTTSRSWRWRWLLPAVTVTLAVVVLVRWATSPTHPGRADPAHRAAAAVPRLAPAPPRLPLASQPAEARRAGFRLDRRTSRFALGTPIETRIEYGLERVIGTEGVIATRLKNGWTMSIPNGDAPSLDRPALTRDSDVHNDRVLKYFLNAGLPAEQVQGVRASTTMSGLRDDTSGATDTTFVAYTSRVDRQLDAVPVPDSHAWARFDDHDEVVTESAYWPEVPEAIVTEARALQQMLQDPERRRQYEANLPADRLSGGVAIRHSSSDVDDTPRFVAVYDVVQRPAPGVVVVRHFGADGTEVRLPQETRGAVATAAQGAPPKM
jgi:hypothetical protein